MFEFALHSLTLDAGAIDFRIALQAATEPHFIIISFACRKSFSREIITSPARATATPRFIIA